MPATAPSPSPTLMCGVGAVAGGGAAREAAARALRRRGPDAFAARPAGGGAGGGAGARMDIMAAVLAMRAPPTPQPCDLLPARDEAAAASWLAYNGEIYEVDDVCVADRPDTPEVVRVVAEALLLGGDLHVHEDDGLEDDGLRRLAFALRRLRGPWAFVLWDATREKLLYARDPLGRRSLVSWFGQPEDANAFGVASAAPKGARNVEEIAPLGVYALDHRVLAASTQDCGNKGPSDPREQISLVPFVSAPVARGPRPDGEPDTDQALVLRSADALLKSLREAVRLRVQFHREGALGVLFSGGLDCAVLAALAHEFLPAKEPIDLFTVCFQAPRHQSPDRRTALASWHELRARFPTRRWNLVCINHDDSDLLREEAHILSLLTPCTTHMDFNIGAALWFAAQGSGSLADPRESSKHVAPISADAAASRERSLLGVQMRDRAPSQPEKAASPGAGQPQQASCALQCAGGRCRGGAHLKVSCAHGSCATCCKMHQRSDSSVARCGPHKLAQDKDAARKRRRAHDAELAGSQNADQKGDGSTGQMDGEAGALYSSPARILLSGLGADEQLAGYGRHRVAFSKKGWIGLGDELEADIARLWHRNLGRDDRCISDHGKEARHPYLDERVRQTIASLPLDHVADPRLPPGTGDKRLLRLVACRLGLPGVSGLAKRAIQFGTRIAQVSRAHAPGSNRSYDASAEYVPRSAAPADSE